MTADKQSEFIEIYQTFKQSPEYRERIIQFAIVPILRDIIFHTLQKEKLQNLDLTGFIQMFKYGCTDKTFDRYLNQNIEVETIAQQLSKRAIEANKWGFVGAGLNSVDGLSENQLAEVKKFLLSSFNCKSESEAIDLCVEFEKKQIPLIKQGIYSQFLYYINPQLFPIVNNSHIKFREWSGINGNYPNCIKEFNMLKNLVNETDLGLIDMVTHLFEKFKISDSDIKKLDLNGWNLYKMSHGVFVKDGRYRDTGIKGVLEQNNWIALSIDTGKGQADGFQDNLKVGDYVYVCYGGDDLYCIAKVTGESTPFDDETDDLIKGKNEWVYRTIEPLYFPLIKSIRELKDDKRFFMPSGNSTFYKVPIDMLPYLNQKIFSPKFNVEITNTNTILNNVQNTKMNTALNTILYGPPGTGKTYHTITKAAEIIAGESFADRYQNAKDLYKEKMKEGQIELITFHQNYSYEDFVAGLRPNTDENNQLSFKEHKGVFYRISQKAKENWESYQQYQKGNKFKEPTFEEVLKEFLKPLRESNSNIDLKTSKDGTTFKICKIEVDRLNYETSTGNTDNYLKIEKLKNDFEGKKKCQPHESYFYPTCQRLKEIATTLKKEITEVKLQNYVLIIDEINRANISRVFGELITLLEPDKRLGEKHELTLRLPGLPDDERFGIPPNLYIVATMNTADKSIALIDIAIRRRFVFEDMYPRKEIINATVPEPYRNFLISLNNTIKEKKGVDFTIGHAYFIADEQKPFDIVEVLNQKVIPLLNEYFYNQRNNLVWNLLSPLQSLLPKIEFVQDDFIGVKAKSVA